MKNFVSFPHHIFKYNTEKDIVIPETRHFPYYTMYLYFYTGINIYTCLISLLLHFETLKVF